MLPLSGWALEQSCCIFACISAERAVLRARTLCRFGSTHLIAASGAFRSCDHHGSHMTISPTFRYSKHSKGLAGASSNGLKKPAAHQAPSKMKMSHFVVVWFFKWIEHLLLSVTDHYTVMRHTRKGCIRCVSIQCFISPGETNIP